MLHNLVHMCNNFVFAPKCNQSIHSNIIFPKKPHPCVNRQMFLDKCCSHYICSFHLKLIPSLANSSEVDACSAERIFFVPLSQAGELKFGFLRIFNHLLMLMQADLLMIHCLLGDLQPTPDAPAELEVELCYPHTVELRCFPVLMIFLWKLTTGFLNIFSIRLNL